MDGIPYEVTTARIDGEYQDCRHPANVIFTDSVKDDLSRRDFTVNAIAWNPDKGLLDPFDGQEDLRKRIIRAVGDPKHRFTEDALRMMRAVRFQAVLGFDIDPKTRDAIIENAHLIRNVSKERINDEICKIILSKHPEYFKKLHEYGLLKYISSDIDNIFGCAQKNPNHFLDVGDHTMLCMQGIEPDLVLRLTMLLHDIGKPPCKTTKDGVDHFYGHPKVSAELAEKFLKEYRFRNKDIKRIVYLIQCHDMLGDLRNASNPKKSVRKFVFSNYDQDDQFFLDFLKVKRADYYAHDTNFYEVKRSAPYLQFLKEELMACLENPRQIKDLKVNGTDMLACGVEPAYVKEMLLRLLRIVINRPEANTRGELLRSIEGEYKQMLNDKAAQASHP